MNYRKFPLVSVVMPVYNGGKFLKEAIGSVRAQSYRHFELICVDDHSTDKSWKILKDYVKRDKKIRVYKLKSHQGISAAANFGIKKTRGRLIARMDADDLMLKHRLAKQVEYLAIHPDVVAVGGQCRLVSEKRQTLEVSTVPLEHAEIMQKLMYQTTLYHPTLMISAKKLPDWFYWYNKALSSGEDLDLYFRLAKYGKLANLNEIVLWHRQHDNAASYQAGRFAFWQDIKSRYNAVSRHGYSLDFESIVKILLKSVSNLVLPPSMLRSLRRKSIIS